MRYGSVVALDGVSVTLEPGCGVLLGPNGAGKSTLLSILAGIRKPLSGQLFLDGSPLVGRSGRRRLHERLGYLPQEARVPGHLTVGEAMAYAAWLKRLSRADAVEGVSWSLDAVGLSDRLGDKVKTLSGGMQRRLAIAQAMVSRPGILLLDEPTTGLDVGQRATLRDILGQIGTSMAVLISTHVVGDVAPIADQVLVLDHGKLRFNGRAATLGRGRERPTAAELESAYLELIRS